MTQWYPTINLTGDGLYYYDTVHFKYTLYIYNKFKRVKHLQKKNDEMFMITVNRHQYDHDAK